MKHSIVEFWESFLHNIHSRSPDIHTIVFCNTSHTISQQRNVQFCFTCEQFVKNRLTIIHVEWSQKLFCRSEFTRYFNQWTFKEKNMTYRVLRSALTWCQSDVCWNNSLVNVLPHIWLFCFGMKPSLCKYPSSCCTSHSYFKIRFK